MMTRNLIATVLLSTTLVANAQASNVDEAVLESAGVVISVEKMTPLFRCSGDAKILDTRKGKEGKPGFPDAGKLDHLVGTFDKADAKDGGLPDKHTAFREAVEESLGAFKRIVPTAEELEARGKRVAYLNPFGGKRLTTYLVALSGEEWKVFKDHFNSEAARLTERAKVTEPGNLFEFYKGQFPHNEIVELSGSAVTEFCKSAYAAEQNKQKPVAKIGDDTVRSFTYRVLGSDALQAHLVKEFK